MNAELEGTCEEAFVAKSRYSLSICLEGTKKIMKRLNQDIVWHVDPLLGNDREIGKYKTAVAK
jgi:hypothetical protein